MQPRDAKLVEASRRSAPAPARAVGARTAISAASQQISAIEILRWPLPLATRFERFLIKAVALFANRQVRAIHGLENLHAAPQPVIVALNHTIKREAILVPYLLALHLGGRPIRFVAQWQYLMIPLVRFLMRRGGVIVVTSNSVRPRFLNRMKPVFREREPVTALVHRRLRAGEWVGIFPEGIAHRDPRRMHYGRAGMARWSLEAGVPVLPIGIRFPDAGRDRPVPENAVMEVVVGELMTPPADGDARVAATRAWHATIMSELARLSGKSWRPRRHAGGERAMKDGLRPG